MSDGHAVAILDSSRARFLNSDSKSTLLGVSVTTPKQTMSIWRPLRAPVFRNLLIADAVSDIGTFMQNVGAAWLMVSFGAGAMFVALTQTAASLPFFLLALPAGSVGDIVDRRQLVLSTEIWMAGTALVITVLTFTGHMTPWILLVLTFALSAGDAFEAPTWRALLPELVRKEDLSAASALNGIEFNFARAVGPAIAGLIIAAACVGTAFAVNTLSFMGVIYVIARWNRPFKLRSAPREHLVGATVAALRFVRYAPAVRTVIVRQGAMMLFASALLALLPTIAHSVSSSAAFYGLLLGAFGGGAVLGALGLGPVRSRWSMQIVTSAAIAIIGSSMVIISRTHAVMLLIMVMLVAGAAWITVMSLVSALIQTLAPDWVRARVLAVFLLVFQGSVAAGSAVWGGISQRFGVATALLTAGIGMIASLGLAVVLKFPSGSANLTPWQHWATPEIAAALQPELDDGPVLVTTEYEVRPEHATEFLEAIHQYSRIRRRDGASRWEVFQDLSEQNRYVEVFLVGSWAEHLRQHDRQTVADRDFQDRVLRTTASPPKVHHLIYAGSPQPAG